MTNKEALKFLIGTSGDVTDSHIGQVLEFNGIDPDGTYDQTNQSDKCALHKAAIGDIKGTIASGVKSVRQGDYSITYDVDSAKSKIQWLAKSSGCQNLIDEVSDEPLIVDKTSIW